MGILSSTISGQRKIKIKKITLVVLIKSANIKQWLHGQNY